MEKPFVLEWLCHADYGTKGVSTGIIAGIALSGDEDDWDSLQSWCAFHMSTEIKAREAIALDFGDDDGGREDFEDVAAVASIVDGDDVVAFASQNSSGTLEKRRFRIENQDERFGMGRSLRVAQGDLLSMRLSARSCSGG